MMYKTHFQTGVLFGLAADAAAAAARHPLPLAVTAALPLACGYLSAIPDVDHHCAKIRYACPPARWLFLFARMLVGVSAGLPYLFVTWRFWIIPRLTLDWSYESRRRMLYWMDHRRITHTRDFPLWLGLAVEPLGLWSDRLLPGGWWWLIGPATALGCWAHRAGDRLTKSGVPGWSWQMDRPSRGWRVRTGRNSWSEGTFAKAQGFASVALVWLLAGTPGMAGIGPLVRAWGG